jgi:hypothetical protein
MPFSNIITINSVATSDYMLQRETVFFSLSNVLVQQKIIRL